MGGAGDSPAPVSDSPTGMSTGSLRKDRPYRLEPLLTFRPASRRTAQAGRLCYPNSVFQTCSKNEAAIRTKTEIRCRHARKGITGKLAAKFRFVRHFGECFFR